MFVFCLCNYTYYTYPIKYFPQVPASQLIHPSKEPVPVRLWHDQLFAKPPKHGGVVAWYMQCKLLLSLIHI